MAASPSNVAVASWFGIPGPGATLEAFDPEGRTLLHHVIHPDSQSIPIRVTASHDAIAVACQEKAAQPAERRVRIQVLGLDGSLRAEALIEGALGIDQLRLDDRGTSRLLGSYRGTLASDGQTLRSPHNPGTGSPRSAVYDRAEVRLDPDGHVSLRRLDAPAATPKPPGCAHRLCALPGVHQEVSTGPWLTRIVPLRDPVRIGDTWLQPASDAGRVDWLLLQFRGDTLVMAERIEANATRLDVFPDGDVLLLLVAFDRGVRVGDRELIAAARGGKSLALVRLTMARDEP